MYAIDPHAVPNIADSSDAGDQLLLALQAMVPDLRGRAGQAEVAGRIPGETIEALEAAGAFRTVLSARHRGLELPYRYIPQISRLPGRGCLSTLWCMGFVVYHNFQFAHFHYSPGTWFSLDVDIPWLPGRSCHRERQ